MSTEQTPRKGATVTLDRERRLRYSLRAIEEIEGRFDVNIMAGDQLGFDSLDDLTWVIWLGLKHAGETRDLRWWERPLVALGWRDPYIRRERVAEILDMENIEEVTKGLARAVGGARAAEEEEDLPRNPTVERGREKSA